MRFKVVQLSIDPITNDKIIFFFKDNFDFYVIDIVEKT